MGQQFMFVDTNNVDPKTRRKMRRHVMAGKNAGRTVHRPSKLALSSVKTRQLAAPLRDPLKAGATLSTHQSPSLTSISGPLRSGLSGVKFAIEMGPYEHGIISTFLDGVADSIFPQYDFITGAQDMVVMCLRLAFSDEGASHCAIGLISAWNDLVVPNGSLSVANAPGALYHLSRALAFVAERLNDETRALENTTFGLIIMLVLHEQIRLGARREARIHVEGLRRMVHMRGGLGQFEGRGVLWLKLAKMDVDYALHHGGPVDFKVSPEQYQRSSTRIRQLLSPHSIGHPSTRFNIPDLNPDLAELFHDTLALCTLCNKASDGVAQGNKNTGVDTRTFFEATICITNRLIEFHSFPSAIDLPARADSLYEHLSEADAVVHCGLLVLMVTLGLQPHRDHRIIGYRLVAASLRSVVDRCQASVTSMADRGAAELMLWVLMLGTIWLSDDGGKGESVKVDQTLGRDTLLRLTALAESLGMSNYWEAVRDCVSTFPWVQSVHDQPARMFWQRVRLYRLLQR